MANIANERHLRIVDGRLFGFQRDAADFCVSQARRRRPCVLAIDTGCGKTLTIREVIVRLGSPKTLLLAPGGLCRQIAGSLANPPWRERAPLDVVYAETGRQLERAIRERSAGVIVANYKVKNVADSLSWPDFLVVDEAHLATLTLLRSLSARGPLLLSTATPFESPAIRHFFATQRIDVRTSCYVFRKTPEVMTALGTARLDVVPSWTDAASLGDYYTRLIASLRRDVMPPLSSLMCLLVVAGLAREVAPPEAHALVVGALRQSLVDAVGRAGLYSLNGHNYFHEASASHVLAERLVASRLAVADPEGHVLAAIDARTQACVERSATIERGPVGELPGFGVTPSEYDHLFAAHARCGRNEADLWTESAAAFATALVRVPTCAIAAHAARLRQRHPEMRIFELHTGLSAAQRALTIRRFASHDGDRANARFFLEGLRRHGSEVAKRALCFGDGWVSLQIYRFLARPRLLLADDAVDVGWELHRHVDTILIPHVVPDRTTLLQLLGRVSRITVDQAKRGSTTVRIALVRGTLDVFFERRLREDVVPDAGGDTDTRSQVLHTEMAEAFLRMAQTDIQRAWLQHVLQSAHRRGRIPAQTAPA
jgi:hypothetical protein